MDGRASTFKKVLADFESRLHGAEFVALDTELTGVSIEGEPDTFEESAQTRLDKICRIAERYTLIQVGLTVVGRASGAAAGEGHLSCASYNLFAFPHVGPELIGREPGFFCQAKPLQFNVQHRVNFNTWIGEGIPYMSREDERRYLKTQAGKEDSNVDAKVGLLRLWKALCAARLPFVIHTPLDLFFLLAAFERRPLPRDDPRALAMMIRQCTPKVYDTAHLHGAFGRFKHLSLIKFFEDAKAQYDERSNGNGVPPLEFELQGVTAVRYSKQDDDLDSDFLHEAGFDSLVTAQLFAYLRAIAPARVKEAANRLFLYRSVEYLDLDRAALEGQVGTNMFDLERVTLLVAALDPTDGNDAPRLIASAGSVYKWMDSTHILVVLRASGGAAVRKAAELSAKVHGVASWMGFDEWRAAQASSADQDARQPAGCPVDVSSGAAGAEDSNRGASTTQSLATQTTALDATCDNRKNLALVLLAAGASTLFSLLLTRGKVPLSTVWARLLRRWRRR
mmetsp:Transcript_92487/g.261839  ORF Transcript_92487/g.261839 Transcript_92487/m.261839 type:complete len:508 (+) Transcript_92487:98-1621(+)